MEWQLSSLHRKRYGTWAGNPTGNPAMPDKCCENVWPAGRFMFPHQCNRARGHGPERAYCKQHDPEYIADKRRVEAAKHEAAMEMRKIEWAAHGMFAALRQIADGHNDPRALAKETIKDLKTPKQAK